MLIERNGNSKQRQSQKFERIGRSLAFSLPLGSSSSPLRRYEDYEVQGENPCKIFYNELSQIIPGGSEVASGCWTI